MNLSPTQKMNLGFGLIWLGGAAFGSAVTKLVITKKLEEDLAFRLETLENTYEAALALRDAADVQKERQNKVIGTVHEIRDTVDGIVADLTIDGDVSIGDVVAPDYLGEAVEGANPYHTAVASSLNDTVIVSNPDADFGVSYIEAEEYQEEDGRHKIQIDIMMAEQEPIFIMDGAQIEDWDRRVGDSILVDMYAKCPPGTESILYVRNHRTDEDYEVVLVTQP